MPTGVYKRTIENRKNIGRGSLGRKLSFEAKKKISEAVKKRWQRGDRVSPMLGKHQSFTAKAKMSKARLKRKQILGYINSPETREKIGKSFFIFSEFTIFVSFIILIPAFFEPKVLLLFLLFWYEKFFQ